MKLSDERVEEFRNIYEKCYKETITLVEAREMASRMLMLYEVLYSPFPGEEELYKD